MMNEMVCAIAEHPECLVSLIFALHTHPYVS
jgi:hypothetical protein